MSCKIFSEKLKWINYAIISSVLFSGIFLFKTPWGKKHGNDVLPSASAAFATEGYPDEALSPKQPNHASASFSVTESVENAELYAQTILEGSSEKLRKERNIHAKMTYTSLFFGEKFIGTGIYQEKKQENMNFSLTSSSPSPVVYETVNFRYEITYQMRDRDIRQIFLMDGENRVTWQHQSTFWKENSEKARSQQRSLTSPRYTKIDLGRVRDYYLHDPEANPHLAPPWYGMRSLETTLYEIQNNFRFYSYSSTEISLGQAKIPAHRLEGEWKKEILQEILTSRRIKGSVLSSFLDFAQKVPEEFPSTIVIYVGKKDLFPYQIEFYRPDSSGDKKLVFHMFFYEVDFNIKFPPREFIFQHRGHEMEEDRTDEFLLKNGKTITPSQKS